MAQDLFSDYLREWMPDRLSAASVLEWLERPATDLSWLLVHTPLSFGASDATPNVLLRLFEHGADSEGWDLLGSVCVACWRFQPSRAYTDGGVRLAAVPHARENVLEIRVAPPWIVPAATRKGLAS